MPASEQHRPDHPRPFAANAAASGRARPDVPAPQPPSRPEVVDLAATRPRAESDDDDLGEVIEIHSPELDLDAILVQIRASIDSKREAGVLRDEAWLSRRLDSANLPGSARQSADRLALIKMAGRLDLAGDPIKSHRPVLGWAIIAWKRFSRYWTRKYTDQIFTRQTHCNAEVLHLLTELVRETEDLRDRLAKAEGALATADAGQPMATQARGTSG
jgi:hypothetical protein